MNEAPPIREITTDDYHPGNYPDAIGGAAWIKSTAVIRDLLQRQHDGEVRLRLILREAVDLKPGRRNLRRMFEYDLGPSMLPTEVAVAINTKDGRHVVVREPAPWGPSRA